MDACGKVDIMILLYISIYYHRTHNISYIYYYLYFIHMNYNNLNIFLKSENIVFLVIIK